PSPESKGSISPPPPSPPGSSLRVQPAEGRQLGGVASRLDQRVPVFGRANVSVQKRIVGKWAAVGVSALVIVNHGGWALAKTNGSPPAPTTTIYACVKTAWAHLRPVSGGRASSPSGQFDRVS